MINRAGLLRVALAGATALGASFVMVAPVAAQLSTATLRGNVTTDGTAPAAGTVVVARDAATGFTTRATAGEAGTYVLSGLRPGSYEITFSAPGNAKPVVVS